jgi:hypothetical protein
MDIVFDTFVIVRQPVPCVYQVSCHVAIDMLRQANGDALVARSKTCSRMSAGKAVS